MCVANSKHFVDVCYYNSELYFFKEKYEGTSFFSYQNIAPSLDAGSIPFVLWKKKNNVDPNESVSLNDLVVDI